MTWSVIAKDEATGLLGIAISTCFFGVGALCPYADAHVGAISTQAMINPTLGPRGLALLRDGYAASDALDMLVRTDERRSKRQIHLVDRHGRTAVDTGAECIDWAGHRAAENVSLAGNMLVGPQVLEQTFVSYQAQLEQPFVDRLLAAMDAGQEAGGDKRGKQSAALRIQGDEPYPRLDLRVDDHPEPLAELRRLYEVAKQHFIPSAEPFRPRSGPMASPTGR